MTKRPSSRTPQNRRTPTSRTSRQQVLDVRVRRSTAKRQRNRRAFHLVVGLVLWIGIAVGLWFGFHAITKRFFLENPAYDLRQVDTQLDNLMTRDEALALAHVEIGRNIFKIDLGRAEQAFRQIDQIATVSIRRDWPDKISITLTKRIPVAWLARAGNGALNADQAWLLDAQGGTMKPFRIEPEYWRLPVIYTPDPALIRDGDTLAQSDLRSALDLLAERARRPDSRLEIRSIDITRGYAMHVTDASNAEIIFSPADPARQLDRIEKLLENCALTGRQLASVNLIPQKYTPVHFLLANAQDKPTEQPQPEMEH